MKTIFRRFATLLKYSASALISVGVDQGMFALLNTVLLRGMENGVRLLLSTVLARVVSSLINYYTNARLVFEQSGADRKSFFRYYALCAVQTALSYGLVLLFAGLFHTSGLGDSLVKMGVDTLLFFVNYGVQKKWVYNTK